ncbi:MAG: helix-hairpin-helix domain-containing protein [Eubacterium sp.]
MKQQKIVVIVAVIGIFLCGSMWYYQRQEDINVEKIQSGEIQSGEIQGSQPQVTTEKENGQVYVHIVGAVKKPGVYTFHRKPRVVDVIEQAGGFTKDAVTGEINQAEIVEDGTQLTIASTKEKKKQSMQEEQNIDDRKINLNIATKEQLMTLAGIGEAKADAIIAYREEKGKFHKIEDLMEIPGIKEGVFDKIKSQICV